MTNYIDSEINEIEHVFTPNTERTKIPSELFISTTKYISTVNSIRQSHWNSFIFENLTQDNLIDFVLAISD